MRLIGNGFIGAHIGNNRLAVIANSDLSDDRERRERMQAKKARFLFFALFGSVGSRLT